MDAYDAVDDRNKAFGLVTEHLRERLERSRVVIGDCTLYNEDCRFILPTLTSENVHMIWTDPPYGHRNQDGDLQSARVGAKGARQKAAQAIANDDQAAMQGVVDAMLKEAARVLRADWCCCCCCCGGGGGPSPTFAWVADRMDRDGMKFFHAVVWDKSARGNGLGWRYRRNYEFVMVAHRASGKLLWADDTVAIPNIFRTPPVPNDDHPTTKPVMLVEHFLKAHSTSGQVVLDPFMGSGTTGVACVKQGRKFIGVEIDKRYFDVACRRIEQAYAQGDMFVAAPTTPPTQLPLLDTGR